MTDNQLRYLAHQETVRHNLATEEDTDIANVEKERANRATEDEKHRSNTVSEAQKDRSLNIDQYLADLEGRKTHAKEIDTAMRKAEVINKGIDTWWSNLVEDPLKIVADFLGGGD